MQRPNIWLAVAGGMIALLVLTACGGGGKSVTGNGGGSVTTRNAAIRNAVGAFAAIPKSTVDVENKAMLAWFQKNPEFVDSGITDQNVWAHCKDHTSVVMVNNRQIIDDGTRSAPVQTTRLPIDLPTSKKAHVINNFGGGNAAAANKIVAMLQAAGYKVSITGGSIAELGNLAGDGVFYIDSHGLFKKEDDGLDTYYLMSSDVYDENNTTNYDAGLANHSFDVVGEKSMVRQTDGTFKEVTDAHYAISNRFAAAHWKAGTFSTNSFVFINACSSGKTSLFRDVCFASGASAYAGWSGDVFNSYASSVGPFVLDRLLGANKVEKEVDGPQRPFDFSTIAGDLGKHGLAADAEGVTLTISQKPGTDFGLLTPTISYMGVDEYKKELTISGIFGTDQSVAKVTMDGVELAIKGWGFNSIVCDLPLSLSGDTIVEVRGHKSNVVRLTEWKAHFKTRLEQTPGSPLIQVGYLDVNFRADIHSHRDEPHQKPFDPIVPFVEESDSNGQYTASGVLSDANGVLDQWSGMSVLKALGVDAGAKNVLVCMGSIDVKNKKIDIQLLAAATEGMFSTKPPGGPEPLAGTLGLLDSSADSLEGPALHLTLNDDFSINGGIREDISTGILLRIQWDKIEASSPPDSLAGRSAATRHPGSAVRSVHRVR